MKSLRTSPTLPAAILYLSGTFALVICILRLAPGVPVPLHIGFAGTVDRYGSRGGLVAMLLTMAAVAAIGWTALDIRRERTQRLHAFVAAQTVLLIAFASFDLVEAAEIFGLDMGLDTATPRFHMATLAMIFAAMGAMLGKVPQNPLVGVRTYWSRSSRLAWEKSNRLGGRLLFWIGVAGVLIAPVVPQPDGFRMLIVAALLTALACVVESWRVWRSDPERTAF